MKAVMLIFLSYCFSISFVEALEKNALNAFFQNYCTQHAYHSTVTYAIEKGYPDVAEFLILQGEPIVEYEERYPCSKEVYKLGVVSSAARNTHVKHPLITAIRKGYKNAALLLIEMGFGNTVEEYKREHVDGVISGYSLRDVCCTNAMSTAIESGDLDIVLALLAQGFDINSSKRLNPLDLKKKPAILDQSSYPAPLLHAIALKKLNIAEALLCEGADIDKCAGENEMKFFGSPLSMAVEDNFYEGVEFLLQYGANPLCSENSPIKRAIKKNYPKILELLLDAMQKE